VGTGKDGDTACLALLDQTLDVLSVEYFFDGHASGFVSAIIAFNLSYITTRNAGSDPFG